MTQDLLIMTSPPASGKTYWIEQFADACGESVLVISPLRALADECKARWGEKIIVMTPEEWCNSGVRKRIIIFDEFHLNFYWGDSFRPLLWDVFYELCSQASLVIALTATFSKEMQQEVKKFAYHFDQITWIDLGNQKLKFSPWQYLKFSSRKKILELVYETSLKTNDVALIFCAYRQEVHTVGEQLRKKGYRVWTCVGGEARNIQLKMQEQVTPQFIVCTTVLSHGVNLPEISKVYLLYPINNIDFWIQMVARGGRKGGKYRVYGLENPYGISWGHWTNFIAILILSVRTYFRQAHQWFLKESLSNVSLTKKGI